MTTIINVSRLLWPMSYPDRMIRRYAVSVLFHEIPFDLVGYVTPKPVSRRTSKTWPEFADALLVRIIQPYAPRLTFTNGVDGLRELKQLQELAKTANIGPDRLFHGLPATLSVQVVEAIEAIDTDRKQSSGWKSSPFVPGSAKSATTSNAC